MSISPLGKGQLTTNIINDIRRQLSDQQTLLEQISSSKRLSRPSDDPSAVADAMNIRSKIARNEQYEKTIDTANLWTNITVTALDSSIDVWRRVNEIAIMASDGTKNANDLNNLATELDQILQYMVQISNTQANGSYVFGGSNTKTPPFRIETDPSGKIIGVHYDGNNSLRQLKTNDMGNITINSLGSNACNPNHSGTFIDTNHGTNAFNTIIQLRDQLQNNNIIGISGQDGIIRDIEKISSGLINAQVKIGTAQEVLQLEQN